MTTSIAKRQGPSREIPPMSYPRRIRAAATLAWRTLRTGQYLPAVEYLQGTRDGMDVAFELVSKAFMERAEIDGEALS